MTEESEEDTPPSLRWSVSGERLVCVKSKGINVETVRKKHPRERLEF